MSLKNLFDWSPEKRIKNGLVLIAAAVVFLIISILFLNVGSNKDSEKNTPPVSASQAQSQDPSGAQNSSQPGNETQGQGTGNTQNTSTPIVTDTPPVIPTTDPYGQLDYRPSSMLETPAAYYVSSPDSELNVRRGPSTAYEKLGTLTNDAQVTVYSIESNWALILYGEQYGWCSADYLKKAE